MSTTIKEQSVLPSNVNPVLKLSDLESKRTTLERELYYLIRKPVPQWYKDKIKKLQDEFLKAAANSTSTTTNSTITDGDKTTEKDSDGTTTTEKKDSDGTTTEKKDWYYNN